MQIYTPPPNKTAEQLWSSLKPKVFFLLYLVFYYLILPVLILVEQLVQSFTLVGMSIVDRFHSVYSTIYKPKDLYTYLENKDD